MGQSDSCANPWRVAGSRCTGPAQAMCPCLHGADNLPQQQGVAGLVQPHCCTITACASQTALQVQQCRFQTCSVLSDCCVAPAQSREVPGNSCCGWALGNLPGRLVWQRILLQDVKSPEETA